MPTPAAASTSAPSPIPAGSLFGKDADPGGAKRNAPARARPSKATQRASAISRYGFKLPIMSDMVEDHVRSRAVGVVAIAALYCVTVLTVVGLFRPDVIAPVAIDGISRPVSRSFFRVSQSALRAPTFRLVGSGGARFGGANFTLRLASFTQDVTYNTLPCSSSALGHPAFENTLDHERVRVACAGEFVGDVVTADEEGVASFDDFSLVRGPPGIYNFRVNSTTRAKHGDHIVSLERDVEESIKFTSTVRRVYVQTRVPTTANARRLVDPQPILRVTDIAGAGIENVQCVAFATDEPSDAGKLAERDESNSDRGANDYEPPGTMTKTRLQRAHNVGQRFAILSGAVSEKSDDRGMVRFGNLTLETSTTREVYLCFSCDGVIGCWSDPSSVSGIDLPKSARYTPPIAMSTEVRNVAIVGSVDSQVMEGTPLSSPLKVKMTDANGVGVAGARAMAILGRVNDATTPLRFLRLGSKKLVHAVSSVSNSDGVAMFENLAFTVPGATSGSANGFQIVACAEGVCSDSSVSLAVKTSVTKVSISSQQRFVRFSGTADGQDNDRATLVGESEAQAATVPSLIRVSNAAAAGVPGKQVTVRAVRLATSTYTGSYALPNVGDEFNFEHLGFAVFRDESVTGEDGFVSVDVRFTHATQDVLDAANADAIGLVFTVDGVDSVASGPVKLAERTAQLLSETNADAHMRKCSRLLTLDAPPSVVIKGKPFGWQTSDAADGTDYTPSVARVKAVDSLGAPVENLLIALVSVEEFETRAPELFLPRAQDFTVTDNTGESSREYEGWFDISNGTIYDMISDATFANRRTSKYNEKIFKKFSGGTKRSDVVEAGPSGTARLMYVALVPTSTAGADARNRATYWNNYSSNQTGITALLDSIFTTSPALISAPNYFAVSALSAYDAFGCRENDNEGCEVACVSDAFDVEFLNPVSEIEFVQSRVPNDVLDGTSRVIGSRVMRVVPMSAYSVDVQTCINTNIIAPIWGSTEYYRDVIANCHTDPYDPWSADQPGSHMNCLNTSSANDWMQRVGAQCGNFLGQVSMTLKDAFGAPTRGESVDVTLLHHPPTTDAWAASEVRTCPSEEDPYCYFDFAGHEMVWADVPDVNTNPFASALTNKLIVFCGRDESCSKPLVIVMQPIQGTDETGFMDIQFLFMPGNSGEYTFGFSSGSVSSPPLTVFVENTLASIQLINEPTTVSSSTTYRVGERIPAADVKLFKSDGTTVAGGYRPMFKFIQDDGSDAPVLVDLGRHAYDMLLGLNYYLHADLSSGVGELDGGTAWIVDGFDGCYAAMVEFAPCGYDDDDDDDACTASRQYLENARPSMFSPVRSVVTNYKYCFDTSGIVVEVSEGYGEITAPSVALTPGIQIKVKTNYRNVDLEDSQFLFAWIAPYDLRQSQDLRETSNQGDVLNQETRVAPENYRAYASGMFAGFLCVWDMAFTVHGPCGTNTFKKMEATITGNAQEYSYVATFDSFTWNQGNDHESFRPVALRARDYFFPERTAVFLASADEDRVFSVSRSIGMYSKPTSISIVTQPAAEIAVGEIFVVTIKATLSTGAPAPFVTVRANVTAGEGISLQTPSKFLDSYFGPQLAAGATDGDEPELEEERAKVVTDVNGNAVFKLRMRRGIAGNYSVYFSSGATKSRKSSPFALRNAVASVTVASFPRARTTVRVALEDLPMTLNFDDNDGDETSGVKVKVTDVNGVAITPDVIQDLTFGASTFQVVEGWESRNTTEEVLKIARGDVTPKEKLDAIYSLVVEGSRRLGDGADAANLGATFEYDGNGPVHVGNGEYRFNNARLVVRKPGTYRTQFSVQGIASSPSQNASDITLHMFSQTEENKRRWADNGAILSMIVLMFLGSMMLRKRIVLVLSLLGGVGTVALLPFVAQSQSSIWRGVMYATASAILLFSALTFIHVMADPTESATHVKAREASMVAYVRLLLENPSEAQRGASDENQRVRYQVVCALRDAITSLKGGVSREAFFFPQRVLGALVVVNIIMPILMIAFIDTGVRISERLLNLADKTAKTAFTFPRVMEDSYASSSADTGIIRGSDEVWVYEQVKSAIGVFRDLAQAVRTSTTIAAALSYVLFLLTSMFFLAEFRASTLRARQGKFNEGFDRRNVLIARAPAYSGTHVSLVVVNYYISCAVLTLLFYPLCSRNLWLFLAYLMRTNYGWILSTILPIAFDFFAKQMFVTTILLDVKSKTIRNRALWSFWELYNLFIGLLAGLAKGVMRFAITLVFAFVAIARVDKLALPTWLNNLLPMDVVTGAYNAMFYVHHSHNAPVFRVAAWLLVECGETHRMRGFNGKGQGGGGDRADGKSNLAASRSKARARTRFELALLLHANPKLRKYRKHAIGVVDDAGEEKREAS